MRRLLRLRYLVVFAALLLAATIGTGLWIWRRALPQESGTVRVAGVRAPVEIVRDRWGVPHIFASSDRDAYFALGWAMAQDRLFQMDVMRRVGQGRLAELFGPSVVGIDRLFRTMDLAGIAARMYATARPEVQDALVALTAGANAYLKTLGNDLPPEYAVLRTRPKRFTPEDFVPVVGFMTWQLNPAWKLEPLYARIVAKVGPRRAAELFPQAAHDRSTGTSRAEPPWRGAPPQPDALALTAQERALLATLPSMRASNSFAVAPWRSAMGHALLANDPHLGLNVPGTWYEAQLSTPQQDVIGVFLPGLPFAVIGHNRHIAWGFVNWNLDAGDFFVEHLKPGPPGQPGEVEYRNRWMPLRVRHETVQVRGAAPVKFTVHSTPHGPLVDKLLPGQTQALSYEWVYAAATDANELDGFYDLNRAHDWATFRQAVSQFGAVAQTATYADTAGHIGMQAVGRVPLRLGRTDGLAYRVGWDGSEEWDGFLPFARNPSVFDPPGGTVAVANNAPATLPPVYESAYYEPEDRIDRIRKLLAAKEHLSVDDLEAIQNDVTWDTARRLAKEVIAAFAQHPPHSGPVRHALEALAHWDGRMGMQSRAAGVFAEFYKHLFPDIFADELGGDLVRELRDNTNQSAVMMNAVLGGVDDAWFDNIATPRKEDRAAILRMALRDAATELVDRMGTNPDDWQWGLMHRITFVHPLGHIGLLAPLFNEGPFSLPGSAETIDKAQYDDTSFNVYLGPSMRQITDLGDPAHAVSVLPLGESGIPASPHYADQFPLWRAGKYHPLLMERDDIDRVAEGRLVLRP